MFDIPVALDGHRVDCGCPFATGYQVEKSRLSLVSVIAVVEKEVEGEIRFVVALPNLPTIYWTPDGSQLPNIPTSLPNPQSDDVNKPSIFINPIPEAGAQGEKLAGIPIPNQPNFKDFILVFPDGSGIKPFYIVLVESGEFGENKKIERFEFFSSEAFFEINFYDTGEINEVYVEFWMNMGTLTQGIEYGYDSGVKFCIDLPCLIKFQKELSGQLLSILNGLK